MADIYGYSRTPKPMSVSTNMTSTISFGGGGGGAGALIQNWSLNYNSDPKEIFELGSNNIYWVRGRPVGQGSIGRIVGGKGMAAALKDAYNVCSGGVSMSIKVKADNCDGSDGDKTVMKLDVKGLVITSVGFSTDVQQQDTGLKENLGVKFVSLEKEENAVVG